MFKENNNFEKFESKVWLSSPTMHGPEIEYVKEAYETNWMSTVGMKQKEWHVNISAANKVRKWSTQARENAAWYQHEELGYNYRMSNVVAGVVRGQSPYLNEHIAQKKAIYERYKEGLKGLPVSMNPMDLENSEPNYWLSCLSIDQTKE